MCRETCICSAQIMRCSENSSRGNKITTGRTLRVNRAYIHSAEKDVKIHVNLSFRFFLLIPSTVCEKWCVEKNVTLFALHLGLWFALISGTQSIFHKGDHGRCEPVVAERPLPLSPQYCSVLYDNKMARKSGTSV